MTNKVSDDRLNLIREGLFKCLDHIQYNPLNVHADDAQHTLFILLGASILGSSGETGLNTCLSKIHQVVQEVRLEESLLDA
jgi:hypothetical protein